MDIDNSLRMFFKQNKEKYNNTPRIQRVISIKEATEILDISETSLRRSVGNGEYLESKGDFRKMGASMVFDLESILNRQHMDHETYWYLKEEDEKEQLNNLLFSDEYNCNQSNSNDNLNLEILANVKKIRELLEEK